MKKANELKNDVYELARPEGRVVGTAGHERAKNLVVSKMRDAGFSHYSKDSFELPYNSEGVDFTNIIGVIESGFPDRSPLLVGAHYDSVIEAPCADDNAAAVVIALAVGEYFAGIRDELERDVIVAIFDAEEPPYFCSASMGSERFHSDQMDSRGVHAAFIMDLVGHDVAIPIDRIHSRLGNFADMAFLNKHFDTQISDLKDLCFITGAESDPKMGDILAKSGCPKGLRVINTLNRYVGDMSDHGVFRRNGIPYLFLSCGRWEHYHMPSDTPEKLSYGKMANILLCLTRMMKMAASTTLLGGECSESDTVELEIDSIMNALSPLGPALVAACGMEEFKTREDIDAFASFLMGLGL